MNVPGEIKIKGAATTTIGSDCISRSGEPLIGSATRADERSTKRKCQSTVSARRSRLRLPSQRADAHRDPDDGQRKDNTTSMGIIIASIRHGWPLGHLSLIAAEVEQAVAMREVSGRATNAVTLAGGRGVTGGHVGELTTYHLTDVRMSDIRRARSRIKPRATEIREQQSRTRRKAPRSVCRTRRDAAQVICRS